MAHGERLTHCSLSIISAYDEKLNRSIQLHVEVGELIIV